MLPFLLKLTALFVFPASLAFGQGYVPDARTLLLDHLDNVFVADGKRMTRPARITPDGTLTGGRPGKGGVFVPGKFGRAIQFHGLMQMVYPSAGNIDLTAGSADFQIALNFDAEVVVKNPGVLSNQLFFTVRGPGRSAVVVYSVLKRICVGVWEPSGQIVCYGNYVSLWKKGEWHHLELRWGRKLELFADGKLRITKDWKGLFGPIDVRPENLRISFGSHIGWSTVESEFALDEVRILGPGKSRLPDRPVLSVPRMAAPKIDGQLGEGEWKDAARTTGFVALGEPVLVEDQTAVTAGWDDEALYIAMECIDPKKRPIVAQFRERDANVWQEDAVDVFLQPGPVDSPYYQFIFSAIGTIYDSRSRMVDGFRKTDLAYRADLEVRTRSQPGRWVMECRIPFKDLSGRAPKDGERWRVNFCRDAESGSRLSSWCFTSGNFHRQAAWGGLVFSRKKRAMRLSLEPGWDAGKFQARLALTGLAFDPLVMVRSRLLNSRAQQISSSENRLADYRAVAVKSPPLVTGKYTATLEAGTGVRPYYSQRISFRVRKAFDAMVEAYPYEGKLWITSNISGLPGPHEGLKCRSRILLGPQVMGECETLQFTGGVGRASIDIDRVPPGKYRVKSEALRGDGRIVGSVETEFEQFPRPKWWRSKAGIDHSVPPPWAPVKVNRDILEVWGRRYEFAGRALPTQIRNHGEPVLTGPIRLILTSAGKRTDLAALVSNLRAEGKDAGIGVARHSLGKLKVELRTSTEFDGAMRCDLVLEPREPVELEGLVLEIPLRHEVATFMFSSTGHSGSEREIGTEAWGSAFMPQVWVGNDDVGFAWFAESDQHWRPRDQQMLEVVPAGDRVTLRAGMVRRPLRLTEPVTYTFGLVATPVKDSHAGDPFWFRFGGLLGSIFSIDDPMHNGIFKEFLRYPAAGNVNARQGTLEFWLAPADHSGGGWREVVNLSGPGGGFALDLAYGAKSSMRLELSRGRKRQVVLARELKFEVGRFTHVAITWGKQLVLYVDGKRCGIIEAGLPEALGGQPEKYHLQFGCHNQWKGSTHIVVDEIRVSGKVRYQGETATVPAEPFQPDGDTLLLDHQDEPFRPDGQDAESRAEIISGDSGELGGVPSIGCSFVPGKFGQAVQIALGKPRDSLEALRDWGSNAMLFWSWFEPNPPKDYGWPPPLFTEPLLGDYRKQLEQLEEIGVRVSPYMAYTGIGAPSVLSRQFGAEWSRRPLSTQPAEPPQGHRFLDCCGHSGFGDYLAAGTEWLLDEVGFDGCYTDGNAHVYPCKNTHHGCGYWDAKGILHATYPIFATREYLKRMYKIIHSRSADGYLVNHVSFDSFIPTMSFTDVYYTGEHEQYENLLKFRVRWQGKQWGVWPALLGGDSHSYEPLYYTWGLLHGVSVWPQGALGRNDMLRKTVNLWETYDRFGYREAEWIPYYRAEKGLARSNHYKVKVSVYLKKGKRALLVIGNLSKELVETEISFDLWAMALEGPSARNALSGRPLGIEGHRVPVRLRPSSFLLAWVE